MDKVVEMTTAMIGVASSAIQAAKELGELIKKYNDLPLYERLVSLQGQVVELAIERAELSSENQRLKQELDLRAAICFDNPYYFKEGDDVPLCPKCFDGSQGGIRSHMSHPAEDFAGGHGRTCRVCKEFVVEGPRQTPAPQGGSRRPYSGRR